MKTTREFSLLTILVLFGWSGARMPQVQAQSENNYQATVEPSAFGILFTVNSAGDSPDAVVGNGSCADSTGKCTLRAAIEEANAQPTDDTIGFNIPSTPAIITLSSALPDLSTNLRIQNSGDKVTVRADGFYRVLNVTTTGVVRLSGLTITDGRTLESGGGISNSGALSLTNCELSGNYARQSGGGISNTGTTTVTESMLSDNATGNYQDLFLEAALDGLGGAIYSSAGAVTVSQSTLSGNDARGESGGVPGQGYGGAIFIGGGALVVDRCTLSGNAATGGSVVALMMDVKPGKNGYGGAIFGAAGTLTVSNCTLSNNRAVGSPGRSAASGKAFGGAICGGAAGFFGVANCTLFGNSVLTNSAPGSGPGESHGGAIFGSGPALQLISCTVSGNSALGQGSQGQGYGGGIAGEATLKSTIMANNTAGFDGPDASGSFTSRGFNLISKVDGATGFTKATDRTGTVAQPRNPKLDPAGLQSNGGPTLTLKLLAGSPAIDQGQSSAPLDQRGFKRHRDFPAIPNAAAKNSSDIGAFERGSSLP